jgi:hypothetical protein
MYASIAPNARGTIMKPNSSDIGFLLIAALPSPHYQQKESKYW